VQKIAVLARVFFLVLVLLLFSSLALALSFSDGPIATPGNATTTSTLYCEFTPSGDGALQANVTWYRNGARWSDSDVSVAVGDGVAQSVASVSSANTLKNQQWRCQVTLSNESTVLRTNSSIITIQNSPPIVTFPVLNQTAYEDSPFSITATASDSDGDPVLGWLSVDLNESEYGGTSLFTISSTGVISIDQTNESLVGLHTMSLLVYDGSDWGGRNILFELIAVNDAPEFDPGTLTVTCEEGSWCNHTIIATDEEDDPISFLANESFINMNAAGVFSFIPVFADVGVHEIEINISDGEDYLIDTLTLTITSINHVPDFLNDSQEPSSAIQNQSERFLFYVNATDIDLEDAINFSVVSTTCDVEPWSITTLENGSGGGVAQGLINVSFSSEPGFSANDFVACRDITIAAFDGKEYAYKNFTLNITNTNDPPTIFEMSYYESTDFNTNMSNLSSAKGLEFQYRVNATDPDMFTYENDSLIFSLFGHDPTRFEIDAVSGLVSSIGLMDDSFIGIHEFLVVAHDEAGVSANRSLYLEVINNSAPTLRVFDASPCDEGVLCLKDIIADDEENNLQNYSVFSLRYTPPMLVNGSIVLNHSASRIYGDEEVRLLFVNYSNFNSSSLAYQFNLTANNSQVGFYELNISFFDLFSASSSYSVSFNITNVNNPPFLNNDATTPLTPLTLFPIVRDRIFEKIIYGVDGDLYYGLDNLTFSYNLSPTSNITANFNLTQISRNAALLQFLPNQTHVGTHNITISVEDGDGAREDQTFNFTVFPPSIPPNISKIRPYSTGFNQTVTSIPLQSTATYPSPHTVYVAEGDAVQFEVEVTPTEYLISEIIIDWFVDGALVKSAYYNSGGRNYVHTFGYFDEGTKNITAVAKDPLLSQDVFEWDVMVFNTNRVPLFINNLRDLSAATNSSVSGPQSFVDFFRLTSASNIVFLDPDDDLNSDAVLNTGETNRLTFSIVPNSSCVAYGNFEFNDLNLFLEPTAIGTCYARFNATDAEGLWVLSNQIQIDILSLDSGQEQQPNTDTRVVQQRITIPFEQQVDEPKEFQLIIPGIATIYTNGTVIIPLRLKNTWDETLSSIFLSANTSISGLDISFSEDVIASLGVGDMRRVNLTLRNYRLDGPFEVNISAQIDSLDYTDMVTLYVNALEKGSEDSDSIRSKIGFARDLLGDNPECQELVEVLNSAESMAATSEQDALVLIDKVVTGCKYLINQENKALTTVPTSFLGRLDAYTNALIDTRSLFTVFLVLSLVAVGIGIFAKLRLKNI